MASQKYTSLAQSTLASGYTPGDTSVTLQTGDGAKFPSAGDFTIAIGSPTAFLLKCTSRTSDVLTVQAAATEGTTAVAKAAGVAVNAVLSAVVLDGIRSDMLQSGVASSLPTTSEAHKGDVYRCTDASMSFAFNGTVWSPFGPIHPLVLPKLSDFTPSNTTGATITDTGAGIAMVAPANGSLSGVKTATLSSTPFTVTMGFTAVIGPEDFGQVIMSAKDSSSGNYINFGLQHNSTGSGVMLHINKINANGTFNAQYKGLGMYRILTGSGPTFIRIKDDGTNRLYYVGSGPLDSDMLLFHSTSRTDFCTSNTFGFNASGSTNYGVAARLIHWEIK